MKRLFTTMALSVLTISNGAFASSSPAQESAPSVAPVAQQPSSVSAEQGGGHIAPISGAPLPTVIPSSPQDKTPLDKTVDTSVLPAKSLDTLQTSIPTNPQVAPQAPSQAEPQATSGETQTPERGVSQNNPGNPAMPAAISSSFTTYADQWIRQPSSTSKNTAAYFKITNTSDKDVIIKEAIAEEGLCERVEIHGYKKEDTEVKKMYKLETVTIPAKTTIEFIPGGLHVMLLGLKKSITKDSNISLTLKILPADGNTNDIIPDVALTLPVK